MSLSWPFKGRFSFHHRQQESFLSFLRDLHVRNGVSFCNDAIIINFSSDASLFRSSSRDIIPQVPAAVYDGCLRRLSASLSSFDTNAISAGKRAPARTFSLRDGHFLDLFPLQGSPPDDTSLTLFTII